MLIKALLCLSQLGRAVEFIQLEEALNHSNDKTSLVKPKALLPLDDFGVTLFFLVKVLKDHWQEVAAIRIDAVGWATFSDALGVTLLAHTWSGWVWT